MRTSVSVNSNPRPSLRRLLLAALAGGLGVFGLGIEPAASTTQQSQGSAIAAAAPAADQRGD